MVSETKPKLAIIDFSKIDEPGTPLWESVRAKVKEAVEEHGCFEALFDKVPSELKDALFPMSHEIFEQPLERKQSIVSDKPFFGYYGQPPPLPPFESLGIDNANAATIENFTNTLWPHQGNPYYGKLLQSFTDYMSELDGIIRRMIVESLGLEKYWEEHLGSTSNLIRVQKYGAPETNETTLGLQRHVDYNTTTILYQNHVGGLQVQSKDGEWMTPKPSRDSFIFMAGQSLTAWTNGRVYAPYHQVIMSGKETRYLVALFSVPKASYQVKAIKELVDEEHPLLYKPYYHFEFLKFLQTEQGQKSISALTEYCDALI